MARQMHLKLSTDETSNPSRWAKTRLLNVSNAITIRVSWPNVFSPKEFVRTLRLQRSAVNLICRSRERIHKHTFKCYLTD